MFVTFTVLEGSTAGVGILTLALLFVVFFLSGGVEYPQSECRGGSQAVFFSFFPHSDITCPKHISAVHVNNVRPKWSLTGQEEIKFDHILGRLCSELCRYIPVPKFLIVTVWTDTGGWSKLQLVIAVTCQNSN